MQLRCAVPVVVACSWILSGCGEAERFIKKADTFANPEQEYSPVPGASAGGFLEPVLAGVTSDSSALLEALSLAEQDAGATNLSALGIIADDSGKPVSVSDGAAGVLTAAQNAKQSFASTGFKRDASSFFSKTHLLALTELKPQPPAFHMLADTVKWTHTSEKFTVSVLDKMPVRNQGQRGTCAAFAAMGQIEGFILKHYPDVTAIDLSEQRFYYMSKPEHWQTGGDPGEQGSDAGTGFAKSNGYEHEGKTYPPGSPTDFNLPLEADCPYNSEPGSTDLQTPQASGCLTGVAKVKDFAAWIHNWEKWLETPQQIYDFLVAKDYPVIVYTKLSANWEDNDGIITLKEAGGQPSGSMHASGHGYLVVGAKKLDEAKFPNEGGMCFIVRNSWGKGWGVNGVSCMTLAWFNAWRFDGGFAVALDVNVDSTKIAAAKNKQSTVPDDAVEPDPSKKGSEENKGYGSLKKRRGTAKVSSFHTPPDLSLTAIDMKVGQLLAGDDQAYKILYKVDAAKLIVRGVLRGNKNLTNDLELQLNDKQVSRTIDGRGDVVFGEFDQTTGQLTLCGKTYSSVCVLNYVSDWNELVPGLTESEAKREDSVEPYEWQGLAVAGYGVEISLPEGFGERLDLRFQLDGKYTNPQRFRIDPLVGAIAYQGQTIGNFQNFSLCSGEYKSLCRVVVAGEKFHVLFKAKKK